MYANNFGIWHTLYHSNWSKRSGGIGGHHLVVFQWILMIFPTWLDRFPSKMVAGWCILSCNFLPAANRPVLQIATRGLFLDFCTRVVAVMAIATSYNWWFLRDYTFYKWGDLLVLITEFYGHLPVINVDQTCEVPIFLVPPGGWSPVSASKATLPDPGLFHRRWSRHLSTAVTWGSWATQIQSCWCLVNCWKEGWIYCWYMLIYG